MDTGEYGDLNEERSLEEDFRMEILKKNIFNELTRILNTIFATQYMSKQHITQYKMIQ